MGNIQMRKIKPLQKDMLTNTMMMMKKVMPNSKFASLYLKHKIQTRNENSGIFEFAFTNKKDRSRINYFLKMCF